MYFVKDDVARINDRTLRMNYILPSIFKDVSEAVVDGKDIKTIINMLKDKYIQYIDNGEIAFREDFYKSIYVVFFMNNGLRGSTVDIIKYNPDYYDGCEILVEKCPIFKETSLEVLNGSIDRFKDTHIKIQELVKTNNELYEEINDIWFTLYDKDTKWTRK